VDIAGGTAMKNYVVIALALLMTSVSFAGESIKSPCGYAAVPSESSEAVCVSVCSTDFAYNGCETSSAVAATQEPVDAAPSLDYLSVRIYGGSRSVADLARALEKATGWSIEVPEGIASEELRSSKKRLKGGSKSLRVRLQDGGAVIVNVDDDKRQLRILSL